MDPAIGDNDNEVTINIKDSANEIMCNGHGETQSQVDTNRNSSAEQEECCESNNVGGEGNPMEEGSTDENQRRSQSPGVHSSSPSEKSNSSGEEWVGWNSSGEEWGGGGFEPLILVQLCIGKSIINYFNHTSIIADKNRPDPVRQICEIPVKIADLGNACWTVCVHAVFFTVIQTRM